MIKNGYSNLFRSSVSFSEIFMKDFWAFTKTQIKRKKIDIIFFMFRLEVTFLQLPLTEKAWRVAGYTKQN